MADHLPSVIATNALAPAQKSQLRRWYESIKDGGNTIAKAKLHTASAMQALRAGGEAGIIGGLLGAAHAELKTGLDVHIGEGKHAFPIDGAVGAGLLITSVGWAQEEFSTDMRTAGATAVGIFSFRKVHDFLAEKKRASGGVPGSQAGIHGEDDMGAEEDPVVKVARGL